MRKALQRPRSIRRFRPSRTTANSALSVRQPLFTIGVCIIPITGISSLAYVFISIASAVDSHCASGEFSIISVANDLFNALQTPHESLGRPTFVCILEFKLENVLAMLATMLSSELL